MDHPKGMKFTHSLVEAAQARDAAQTLYDAAVTKMIGEAAPLPVERFNELVVELRTEITAKIYDSSRSGIEGFVRASLDDSAVEYTFEEVVRLAHTYRRKKSEVCQILQEVNTGRSDDSHSDLCDSFPLLGETWLETLRLIPKEEMTWKLLEKKAKELLPNELYEAVFRGENYVKSQLEEHIASFVPSALLTGEVTDPQSRMFSFRVGDPSSQVFALSGKLLAGDKDDATARLTKVLTALKVSFDPVDKMSDQNPQILSDLKLQVQLNLALTEITLAWDNEQ